MTHPSREELQALVMGTEVADEPALLRHLAACPVCSRRLAREAQLELDLHALAAASSDITSGRGFAARGRELLIAAAACVALAMVLVWWLLPRAPGRRAVATPAATAMPAVPAVSSPCLVDPRTLGPGADVFPPAEFCRDVRVSAGPLSSPDS